MAAEIVIQGSEMRVPTTARMMMFGSPVFVVLGAALVFYASRGARGEALWIACLMGPLLVGSGLYFAFLRKGLVLDRDEKRVTAWWSWLGLRGAQTVNARGKQFVVERFTKRSNEGDSSNFYRILLGEELLHTISEDLGGSEAATSLAKRMAKHLDVDFQGQRDCREMLRRDAIAAKYALAPLLVVLGVTVMGAVVLLVTMRP